MACLRQPRCLEVTWGWLPLLPPPPFHLNISEKLMDLFPSVVAFRMYQNISEKWMDLFSSVVAFRMYQEKK